MSYLLDSDWVISHLGGRAEATRLIAELRPFGLALSSITCTELMEGIYGGRNPERGGEAFTRFLEGADVLPFTLSTAEHAARIRLDLRWQKRQIRERALDLLIAATAIEHDLVLVTRNAGHFADISGLRLYNPA